MRILVLHSRYLSGSLSGENRVVEDEAGLLREWGHEVEVLALSPRELPRRALAARSLVSHGVADSIRRHVRSHGVDLVHVHNLYPAFGPGVLSAASEAGAVVVMTLHNYRLMCIAGTLLRNGRVCEVCLGKAPWRGVVHACYRGSRAESAVLATSLAAGRARGAFDKVHRFLAVSEFVRAKHVQAGLPPDRIVVKPNVVRSQARRTGPGAYFLVLSRLSPEKGIVDLVRAWTSDLGELRVVGDGPQRRAIEVLARARGIRVEGPADPADVPALLREARAVLLPSASFEGQSRVVLEAYATGVPVLASRIGALVELVSEDETGLTVPLGSARAWREAVMKLRADDVSLRLGAGAHARWEDRFSPERGRELLEAAYREALEERSKADS
jgi:glycosyltransferase involved in cell wall biosynthesis